MLSRLAFLVSLLLAFSARAAEPDYSTYTNEELIDALMLVDTEGPGIHPTATVGGFIGVEAELSFEGGVLGSAQPTVPPQMRELVRRGLDALPALLAHLQDDRRTQLVVEVFSTDAFMFLGVGLSEEYDPRDVGLPNEWPEDWQDYPDQDVTLRVGDICFVLIGQIVNRNLLALRYQPTALLVVNSPVLVPRLAERVRADWESVTAEEHIASLVADLEWEADESNYAAALVRLRHYYPESYARLEGDNARKRAEFEYTLQKDARYGVLHNAAPPREEWPEMPPLEAALAGCDTLEGCLGIFDAYALREPGKSWPFGRVDEAYLVSVFMPFGEAALDALFTRATGLDRDLRIDAGGVIDAWPSIPASYLPQLRQALRIAPAINTAQAIARFGPDVAIPILAEAALLARSGTVTLELLVGFGEPALPALMPLLADSWTCDAVVGEIGAMDAAATANPGFYTQIALDTSRNSADRITAIRGLAGLARHQPFLKEVLADIAREGSDASDPARMAQDWANHVDGVYEEQVCGAPPY